MKKQICVTSHSREYFEKKCNGLLSEGWKIVPGSVAVSTIAVNNVPYSLFVAFFETY